MVLRDCENCLVYGTDNRPLAKARVELSGEERIRLFFRYSKLRSIRVKTYTDFYDGQQGVVRCQCELVIQKNHESTRLQEPWMAECTILKVQDTFQRQKDLRVKVKITTEFTSESRKYFSGRIENVSAGGLFLVTSQVLEKGEHFVFRNQFSQEAFQIEAKVLRVGGLIKGEYSYGCQFVGLSMDAEAAIRKFVYTKQKEKQNVQRNRGL